MTTTDNPVQILHGERLVLGDVHITFQRTLRIPDSKKTYPLPPGLGTFPLRRVADYADRVPAEWVPRGGIFLPMYQREAMWISLGGAPHALKVGVGKVCAISGERWSNELHARPQDYVVVGRQPWLDGIAAGKGTIRQFVAMPLGRGLTVEAQVTGEERFGGIQLQLHAPRPGTRAATEGEAQRKMAHTMASFGLGGALAAPAASMTTVGGVFGDGQGVRRSRGGSMGLAAGGKMKQKIYPDPYGVDTWASERSARVFVHIVNSQLWREITGEEPPATPVTAKSYASAGLPWFDLYDEGEATLSPSETLAQVKSLATLETEQGVGAEVDESDLVPLSVKRLWRQLRGFVQDGQW